METDAVVQSLAALAQESRLAVYRLLVRRGPDGFTPSDLVERLAIPSPTLSFHLKELQRSGLISSRRKGRFLYYSANFERMRHLIEFLTENCCSLSDVPCDSACEPKPVSRRKRA